MKKNLLLLSVLLAVAFGYGYYNDRDGRVDTSSALPPTDEGANIQASDFSFTALNGREYSLKDFRGKAVVLNFWASWCAPCVIEFPHMLKLAENHKNTSVFLFLSQDENREDIENFLKKHSRSLLPQENVMIAHDAGKTIAQSLYQTYKLPETYLIDSKGFIQEKIIGADIDWTSKEMNDQLENLSR